MTNDLMKKAVEMLLGGATLVSEPCPYCNGVRVIKDGNALCVNCGKKPDEGYKITENKKSKPDSHTLMKLQEKLKELSEELSNESNHEKQQSILKSINSLVEIIDKIKK
jgi:UPF0148 protein